MAKKATVTIKEGKAQIVCRNTKLERSQSVSDFLAGNAPSDISYVVHKFKRFLSNKVRVLDKTQDIQSVQPGSYKAKYGKFTFELQIEDVESSEDEPATSEEEEQDEKNYQIADKKQKKDDKDDKHDGSAPATVALPAKQTDSDQEVKPPQGAKKKKKTTTPAAKKQEKEAPSTSSDDEDEESTSSSSEDEDNKPSSQQDKKQTAPAPAVKPKKKKKNSATKTSIELYSQYDTQFQTLVDAIKVETFDKACAGSLVGLVGKNNNRKANDHYSQHRTIVPYAGSFVHWLLTGKPYAPGNRHAEKTDHSNKGQNSVHFKLSFSKQDKDGLVGVVRSLFPFTEVQTAKYSTVPHEKLMAVVDRTNEVTYLIRITWHHQENTDNIACSIKSFKSAPVVQRPDLQTMIDQFSKLGIKAGDN